MPSSWLADPSRVYPVNIDPIFKQNPQSGYSGNDYGDTIVSSGDKDTNHGASINNYAGDSTVTDCTGYCRSLIGFDLSSLSGDYIHSATFSAYKWASGGSAVTTYLGYLLNPTGHMPWTPAST